MCPITLWSVEDSQKARMFPLRSVRWRLDDAGPLVDRAHCVLPEDFCAACRAAMYAWNCCGATTFSLNSIRLW